jgi:15-cis-phytoene synthase
VPASDPRPDDLAYLTALVRARDRPRYYATLFAPAALRSELFALYGFAAEIARIPDQVSEGGLGEIRLKWWGDALAEAVAGGRGADSPALRGIVRTIEAHALPVASFQALIDAYVADLYADPPPSLADLEGRLGETQSALFQMASIIAGSTGPETADAAGHAGVAYGLARRLATMPAQLARGRTILPADFLAQASVTPAEVFAPDPRVRLQGAVRKLVGAAHSHLGAAKARVATLPRPLRTIFLPLAVVHPLLRRVGGDAAANPAQPVEISDLVMLIRIAAARLRGRF